MAIITEGPEWTDTLNKVLKDNSFDWDDFERLKTGEAIVSGIRFFLRVGLHMKMPRQAIIATEQFVRIRPYHGPDMHKIKLKLDPKNPDINLFRREASPYGQYWAPDCPEPQHGGCDMTILDNAVIVNRITRPRRI
jgi:hypothetical protein